MYIVSEFHDYYDSVARLGIDKQCVYLRKEVDFEHKFGRSVEHPSSGNKYSSRSNRRDEYEISYRLMGFCGKIYPFVIVVKRWYDATERLNKSQDNFFYSLEKLNSYLATEEVAYYQSNWYWKRYYRLGEVGGMENFFNPDTWKHFLDYFHKHKVPAFLIGSKHVILNPRLGKFGFQQLKDAYSAYQDIYQYISGVLGTQANPMIEVSDEVKAASRGHDGKYSFRKPPGTKRGKPKWR